MGNMLSQSAWIPTPPLTEQNLPDQTGKVRTPPRRQLRVQPKCIDLTLHAQVFIVTGGNAGVGFELCKILYSHNATVYLAGRSEEKCNKALVSIKTAVPNSKGQITFLKLDLGDLASIKGSADEFLSKEKRLDWLCNNAGVMVPPKGSKTAQVSPPDKQRR
jgi:retinol dehydrogenase 12